jgi:hypothetical protein
MHLARLLLAALLVAPPALAQSDDAPPEDDPHAIGDPHGGDDPHGMGDPGEGADPHGGDDPHGGAAGMFQGHADSVDEDASLPAGSIAVVIADADDKPLPSVSTTVGILHQSVARGESRSHLTKQTDATGAFRVDGQEKGSGVAYRITVARDGAVFAAAPFNLPATRGVRVRLHVYPVTHDLDGATVAMQGAVYAELKDDRVQLQTALQIVNFGKTAWVPSGTLVELPPNFTALRGNDDTSDRGVEGVDKKGAALRGTFGPGRWDVAFTWQLPYEETREIGFEVGFPPHVALGRVLAQASQRMTLTVDGFPAAQSEVDREGQRILITEKQARTQSESIRRVRVTLGNLPTRGPGRYIASALTALAVLGGLGVAYAQRGATAKTKKRDQKIEQDHLLAELEELERLHRAGDVGPRTYERARREIIDALARLLAKPSVNARSGGGKSSANATADAETTGG